MVLDEVIELPASRDAVRRRHAQESSLGRSLPVDAATRARSVVCSGSSRGGSIAQLRRRVGRRARGARFRGLRDRRAERRRDGRRDVYRTISATTPYLPADRPRYLMGVGTPRRSMLEAVERGVDMFDCVMPTRNGRNALAYTDEGPDSAPQRQVHTRDPASAGRRLPLHRVPQPQPRLPPPPLPWRARCSGRSCCRFTTSRTTNA